MRYLTILLLIVVALSGFYGYTKSLPAGLNVRSELYPISAAQVRFLADRTYHNADHSESTFNHTIFDTMLERIDNADELVLLDMFLFNNHQGAVGEIRRPLSSELTERLLASQSAQPDRIAVVISDPINGMYGTIEPDHFIALEQSRIPVTITDLPTLPDSNPMYSALYRSGLQFMPPIGGRLLPNIFDANAPGMHLQAYTRLLNFKANHRKVLVTGGKDGWSSIITSMNAHDASSEHSNVALEVQDHIIIADIIQSEQSVLNFSETDPMHISVPEFSSPSSEDGVFIQLLTEQAIKDAILSRISSLRAGDHIDIAAFYISDRDIVRALKAADTRGVTARLLFDPNRDAFGREKNGIPNRQVAHELMLHTNGNTTVRWCVTAGEQCHSKFVITRTSEDTELILGSANFTRRNLDNRNLETNLRLIGPADTPALAEAQTFFDEQWQNPNGRIASTEYETYADTSRWRMLWYHIGEFTGLSHY